MFFAAACCRRAAMGLMMTTTTQKMPRIFLIYHKTNDKAILRVPEFRKNGTKKYVF